MQHAEREIVNITKLCNQKGNLNPESIGYARKPIIECNLSGHYMRKKKWNYWCVFGDEILFSVTISHFDYAAVCFVYFLEYETQRFFEKTITIPLGMKMKLPTKILETVSFSNNEINIQLKYFHHQTKIIVTSNNFDNDLLQAHLTVYHPQEDDTLNVVVPWNRYKFQFTAKHHCLPTEGYVQIGTKKFTFQQEDNFAVLDFGRGIWPRNVIWNWAMASQRLRNKRIGLNLGGKWTDGTGMTENAIFIDGKMTKIHEDVIFKYDHSNLMKPWSVTTKFSNSISLTFHPFFERVSKVNIKLVKSEVHQMVGYYDGKVTLENGCEFPIRNMLGCIEEHTAKW